MDKSQIKNTLIKLQEEAVATLQQAVAEFQESADIDEQESHDPEDYVHQQEATDLKRRMQIQLQIAESDLSNILANPLEPCETVQKGALVETDYLNFYVGISSLPFQAADKKVVGISTLAPLYLKIKGKKVGDLISIGAEKYPIKSIA